MDEEIELMSLDVIEDIERMVAVDEYCQRSSHNREALVLCQTARAAHKLKQRVEELEEQNEALSKLLKMHQNSAQFQKGSEVLFVR